MAAAEREYDMNSTHLIVSIGLAVVVAASAQAGILGSGSVGGGLGAMGGRGLSGTSSFNAQGQFEGLDARDRVGALKDRTGAAQNARATRPLS